jgi:hypothetical protein
MRTFAHFTSTRAFKAPELASISIPFAITFYVTGASERIADFTILFVAHNIPTVGGTPVQQQQQQTVLSVHVCARLCLCQGALYPAAGVQRAPPINLLHSA